jgi:transcriptional regulator with GAF, ATPase, and Fis domain
MATAPTDDDPVLSLFEQAESHDDFDAAFCRALLVRFDAEFASIIEPTPDGVALQFRCAPNLQPDEMRRFRFLAGEGICGAAAASGRTIAVFDARECPQHLAAVDAQTGLTTGSLLAAPAMHGGRCLAVVELMNRRPGPFDEFHKALARSYAALYAARLAAGKPSRRQSAPPPHIKNPKSEIRNPKSKSSTEPPVIVGASVAMQQVLNQVLRVGPTDLPVLVLGESGTGKELIARRLHAAGPRRDRPLVTINCAAITESLLESELFGHRKGAFTGADRDRRGKLQEADGGTVFLDEVGDMSPACQAKLLRALDYGEISPVGGNDVVTIDVRIVAATNQPLEALIQSGEFRRDLYHRLRGVELNLPALRARPGDIELLAEHFLRDADAARAGEPPLVLEPEALAALLRFPWPGNVRELRFAIKYAVMAASGPGIRLGDLPEDVRRADFRQTSVPGLPTPGIPQLPLNNEAQRLLQILRETAYPGTGRWNLAGASRALGMPRKTLEYKIKKVYCLDPPPA